MTNPDPEAVQRYVDAAMSVLTPLVSDDSADLSVEMFLTSDPETLSTGLLMACGWMLGVLDEAGVDQLACLQAFAAQYNEKIFGAE